MNFIIQELENRGCYEIKEGNPWNGPLITFRHRCQYYSVLSTFTFIPETTKVLIRNLEISKSDEFVLFMCENTEFEKRFHTELFDFLKPIKAKTLLWVATVLLGLHQRAVITANHPLRKLERGEFKDDEYNS